MTGLKYPCSVCSMSVCNLPRHLREKHKISPTSPIYNYLRKFKPGCDQPKNVVDHRLYRCTFENCPSPLIKRLDKHLKAVHGITSGTPEYDEQIRKRKGPGMIIVVSNSTPQDPSISSKSSDEPCQDGDTEEEDVE